MVSWLAKYVSNNFWYLKQTVNIQSISYFLDDIEITTPAPPRLFYEVEVKLVNLGAGFKAPEYGSQDFDDISNKISSSFSPALEKVPGYHGLRVDNLRK